MHSRCCWPTRNSSAADCSAIHSDRSRTGRRSPAATGRRRRPPWSPTPGAHQSDEAAPLGVLDADELQQAVADRSTPRMTTSAPPPGRRWCPGKAAPAGDVSQMRAAAPRAGQLQSACPRPLRWARSTAAREGGGGHDGRHQGGVVAGRLDGRLGEVGGGGGRQVAPARRVDQRQLGGGVLRPWAARARRPCSCPRPAPGGGPAARRRRAPAAVRRRAPGRGSAGRRRPAACRVRPARRTSSVCWC